MDIPIARFARWFAHRNERPADLVTCAVCGVAVAQSEGEWDVARRQLRCASEDCYFESVDSRAW